MNSSTRGETSSDAIIGQLRCAVLDLRRRGLRQASKFASELLLGIPDEIRRKTRRQATDAADHGFEDGDDMDRCEAAIAALENGEYLRSHHILASQPHGHVSRFLKHYTLYLVWDHDHH